MMLLAGLALIVAAVPTAVDAGNHPADLRMSLSGDCPAGKFYVEILVNKGPSYRISKLTSSGKSISKSEIDKLNAEIGVKTVESLSAGSCDSEGSGSLVFYVGLRATPSVQEGMLVSGKQIVHRVVISQGVLSF